MRFPFSNFGLWKLRDLDRLRVDKPILFKAKHNLKRCSSRQMKWDFGDNIEYQTNAFTLQHTYDKVIEAGTLSNDIQCETTACGGTLRNRFTPSEPIKVRPELFKEYTEKLEKCSWYNLLCYKVNDTIALWGELEDILKAANDENAEDAKQFVRDTLDEWGTATAGSELSEGKIRLLGALYAVNDIFFPEGVLDVSPQKKAVRGVGIMMRANAPPNVIHAAIADVKLTAKQIIDAIPWKAHEQNANKVILAERGAVKQIDVARGQNGFDGAGYYMKDGSPVIVLIESKHWSGKVRSTDLSAFGLKKEPATFDWNMGEFTKKITADATIPDDVKKALLAKAKNKEFEVHIVGIKDAVDKKGVKYSTPFDDVGITAKFAEKFPNAKVFYKNLDLPPPI